MERAFQIIAVVLAGIAAFFLYNGNREAAFITVVFGCVSFFFSVRAQSKQRVDKENSKIIAEKYGDEIDGSNLSDNENSVKEFDLSEKVETADRKYSAELTSDDKAKPR